MPGATLFFNETKQMKKITLLLVAFSLALGMNAQVSTRWLQNAKASYGTDREGTSIGVDMARHEATGNLYYLHEIGTYSTSDQLCIGEQVIGQGTNYTGTSSSGNATACITKLSPDGKVLWNVYSLNGEIAANDGGIVVHADGSATAALKLRHTDGRANEDIAFTDATGKTTTLDWHLAAAASKRNYCMALVHVSAAGAIEWIRRTTFFSGAAEGEGHIGEAVNITGMVTDGKSIFVAGRYMSDMTLTRADGSTVVMHPHNVEGWDLKQGIQDTRGDLFIARFDMNGWFEQAYVNGGVAKAETGTALAIDGDRLYFASQVLGCDSAVTVGNNSFVLSKYANLVMGCLDTNLQVQWAQALYGRVTGETGTGVLQNLHLNVLGSDLWLTGMGNFNLTDAAGNAVLATASSKPREAILAQFAKADGSLVAATTSRLGGYSTAITGYMGVLQNAARQDSIYTFGYSFNAADGIFLRQYAKTGLVAGPETVLLSGGSMATAYEMLAAGNSLYTITRSRLTSKGIGSNLSVTSSKYATILSAFTLPFSTTKTVNHDLNGDGMVNNGDVTTLINMILRGQLFDNADLNGDGQVNIADVTLLVNTILSTK